MSRACEIRSHRIFDAPGDIDTSNTTHSATPTVPLLSLKSISAASFLKEGSVGEGLRVRGGGWSYTRPGMRAGDALRGLCLRSSRRFPGDGRARRSAGREECALK